MAENTSSIPHSKEGAALPNGQSSTNGTASAPSTSSSSNSSDYPFDTVKWVGVDDKTPFRVRGKVVKGFQRGRELGVRTANLDPEAYRSYKLLDEAENGVYVGWSSVDRGEVHKCVLSIGYNPFFKNANKTVEAHILHEFPEDFYGSELSLVILGYIRPQLDFQNLDALMHSIRADIDLGSSALSDDAQQFAKFSDDMFFRSPMPP